MDALGLGTLIVSLLTEAAHAAGAKAGTVLPPFVKQVLALLVSTGVVNLANLHLPQFGYLGSQGNNILDTLLLWFAGMLLHDVVIAPATPSGKAISRASGGGA